MGAIASCGGELGEMSRSKKKTRMLFPPDVFNERVSAFVEAFYAGLKEDFEKRGWPWAGPLRSEAGWSHPELDVSFPGHYEDGAIKRIKVHFKRLPGTVGLQGTHPDLVWEHVVEIALPREYPANLNAIKFAFVTRIFHPRVSISGTGTACVVVNGDIDRVITNIKEQILLNPAVVMPPSLFGTTDHGNNYAAMVWYERDPHGIHRMLVREWEEAHGG